MESRNWNDEIPKLGIEKLVPEPGCLVEFDGKWKVVVRGFEETPANMVSYGQVVGYPGYTPILPRVPSGKTCWDVLRAEHPHSGLAMDDDRVRIELEVGSIIIWKNGRHGYYGRSNHDFMVESEDYPAHMQDMQKYGALLEWIAANEVTK